MISIIIPAYNEEKRLPKTLSKIKRYFANRKEKYELLIINDASTDETVKKISRIIADWPQVKILSYDQNQGKGFAVKTGMQKAKGKWCLMMDADSSTDISEVEKLIPFIKEYDVIIGSRYLHDDSIKVKQPFLRRIVSRVGNLMIRNLTGLEFTDTQCGFKMFSSEAAKKIFHLQTIHRWAFDIEVLVIAKEQGLKIKEVPVDWYNAKGSQVSKTALWKTLQELWATRRNLNQGKYSK